MHFETTELNEAERGLRQEVRMFLSTALPAELLTRASDSMEPGIPSSLGNWPNVGGSGWRCLRLTADTTDPRSIASSSLPSYSGGALPSAITGSQTDRSDL